MTATRMPTVSVPAERRHARTRHDYEHEFAWPSFRRLRHLDDRVGPLSSSGVESLWVAEHSHIPTSRLTPWPAARPAQALLAHDGSVHRAHGCRACLQDLKVATASARGPATPSHTPSSRQPRPRLQPPILSHRGGWNKEEMADHAPTPHSVEAAARAGRGDESIWTRTFRNITASS